MLDICVLCPPTPHSYVEILIPKIMILESGASERL